MSTATVREFRDDPNGVSRLMAAPGDEAPAAEAVAPAPVSATMGAQDYSPTPDVDVYAVRVPAVAAASDSTVNIGDIKRDGTVTKVAYIPDSAITGANTETRTISVLNKGQAGTGTTSVASLALTSGVNAAVSDEKALTLNGTAANKEVVEGDVLAFKSLHSGSTGLADPGGLIVVEVQPEFD